jgi:hypothetical protein
MATRQYRLREFDQGAPPTNRPLELLCEDKSGTYLCDAKPQDLSPGVPHNQQSVEQSERDGRNDKQSIAATPSALIRT